MIFIIGMLIGAVMVLAYMILLLFNKNIDGLGACGTGLVIGCAILGFICHFANLAETQTVEDIVRRHAYVQYLPANSETIETITAYNKALALAREQVIEYRADSASWWWNPMVPDWQAPNLDSLDYKFVTYYIKDTL